MVKGKNMTVEMSHIRTDNDRIELFHDMVELIQDTLKDTNKHDYIVLDVVKKLNNEDVHYDGKFLTFSKFIDKIENDTRKKGWFYKESKLKHDNQLKTILIKIFSAITNVISKKDVITEVNKFINNEYGYDISDKQSVNIFNLLLNYRYYYTFDTHKFIDIIYPELASETRLKRPPPPAQILDSSRNDTRKQGSFPKRTDAPASGPPPQAGGTRRNRKKTTYPFGAPKIRRNQTRKY